jgi:phosphate starvation-inducible PhoH-like protein
MIQPVKRGLQLYMKKTKYENRPLYIPKTINQEKYFKTLNNDDTKIVISTGPAGCGKTLFACQKAITDLKSEKINKIIITRPVVSVDEEIGFLPGNIIKKMDPWTKPIFDILLDFCSRSELDIMLMNGKIEICPLAFMRGRTFKYSFIIADEMQNSSPSQMKMLTTRLGEDCRMVITGDLQQTDFIKENGLYDFVNKIEKYNQTSDLIQHIQLDSNDIERSEIVKKVIEIYDYKNHMQNTSINNETNNTIAEKNITSYRIYNNDDAALIPIQHVTKYQDIFSYRRDF